MNKKLLSQALNLVGAMLAGLFGQLRWHAPIWLKYLSRQMKRHPYFTGPIVFICLLAGYGYHYYQHLPQKARITLQITAAKMPAAAKPGTPAPMAVTFGINQSSYFIQRSVAPLAAVGKTVTSGISLMPALAGTWKWETDRQLLFSPTEDWPAGEEYTLRFKQNIFARGTELEQLTYHFTTQPFKIRISEFKFYQDPVNPELKQVVATIHFNYPVDLTDFTHKTALIYEALKNDKLNLAAQQVKFTLHYVPEKQIAYLHSEPLALPVAERYLQLIIKPGVKPFKGNHGTTAMVSKSVLIPDAASYFKIEKSVATIVRNAQDRPEQILTVETTIGSTAAELNRALQVYLLPDTRPATNLDEAKPHYVWRDPGEVTPAILALAEPVQSQALPVARDYATLHSYKFSAPAGRFLYLKIAKGVPAFGGFTLAQDYTAVVPVPAYPKEINFLHSGALLALTSEKKLSVIVRGVPAVKFQIARVLPNAVNQLVTQTTGKFSDPQFIHQSFNQQNISELFTEIQQFDATDPAKAQYTALDVGKYLATTTQPTGPRGLFLLRATGWDVKHQAALNVSNSRLILITDLGLFVKTNRNGNDVFAQSITQGVPLANVKIAILGKNGLPILTQTTDAVGHAAFPALDDFTEEREPTVFFATHGDDVAFIPYQNEDRQLNYSRYDVGGVYSHEQDKQTLSAYLFSDRGVYRPGDTAQIALIAKQTYVTPQPAGLPLEMTVLDARGMRIKNEKFTLDATGYNAFALPLEATAPTGSYTVNLFLVRDGHADTLLGSTSFQVADFQPDRLRVAVHLSKEQTPGWISPADLTAKVNLWNLYGAPATEHKVGAKILLTPQRVQFAAYPQYIFFDPLFDASKTPKVFTETLTDTTTDAKGQAEFALDLAKFARATYQLTFFAEGFAAESGRSVTAQTSTLISPLAYFIGYKPDGDLNYIKQNSQRTVNFLALNPQLNPQAVDKLRIQLTALHPVTTLVKNPDGTYAYRSIIQAKVVNVQPFVLPAIGATYALPTQQIGDFALTILDQENTELSHLNYSVVGASQLPLAKNAELTVKLQHTEYRADEDVELQITAPYAGSGLITLERDKIYALQWFKAATPNSVQKIHIPKDFQGNGYVNVAFVRAWDSPEIFVSPLSYAVAPFQVQHTEHALAIDLTIPKVARPGEPFKIKYHSDKAGKIIVFAVDEGILQVTHYLTPDPLAFFFQKRALEVWTQQTVDQILPQFIAERELSAVGGDGGEAALRINLNPFKRKTDLPVVYWSGIVDTDATPRELNYLIPDYFNGSLRVMAVGVAADAVGAAAKNAEVRGNFIISPNVPTFAAPTDEFEVTASVANNLKNSGPNAKVNVQLAATPALEIMGAAQQEVVISEGQEQTVRFKLRAKPVLGSATLIFMAHCNGATSKMTATLSVRPASPYLTTVLSGAVQGKEKSLAIDRILYPEYRHVTAAISTNPLILITGLKEYLANFPYGCTEQLTSKAFLSLVLAAQQWLDLSPAEAKEKIQTAVQMLAQRQQSSGGFSYWPGVGANYSNKFASVYALHFLTEARAAGYAVPLEMLRAGMEYLKEIVTHRAKDLTEARIQAYAIYVLTRNEIVTTNYITHLQLALTEAPAWRHDIISVYLAATYQLLKDETEAERLIEYYQPQSADTNNTDFYSPQLANAEYLYLLAQHFPARLAAAQKKLLLPLVTAMNSGKLNTLTASYIGLALHAYAQSLPATNAHDLSIQEALAGGKQKILTEKTKNYIYAEVDALAKKINFQSDAAQTYFYQLTQSGFDKKYLTTALQQGLEVYREYRDLAGNVITEAKLGEEIVVHLRLRALTDHFFTNIALVDLLPGGFEVVRDSLTTDLLSAQWVEYADAREDRVIFFTSVGADAKAISYRIKATNIGNYTVPPVYAGSMYDPAIKAQGIAGNIRIIN